MPNSSTQESLELQVARFRAEAHDVVSIELIDPLGGELPAWQPGAHVVLHLPDGVLRCYSLYGDCRDRYSYWLAVGLLDSGQGSRWIHGHLREGDRIRVTAPRNLFPLDPEAASYCFIAGGIGITPLLAMLQWCQAHAQPWRLIYSARNRQHAAFSEELAHYPEVSLHFDEEAGSQLDIAAIMQGIAPGEQVWCCGPRGMMQAVQQHGAHLPAEYLHFESFVAPAPVAEEPGAAFEVVLRRSGRILPVPVDRSILDVLLENGVAVSYACRSGVCGACMTDVLAGEIEHRDMVLTDEQRAAGNRMMVCVSRARGRRLELDL